MTEKEKAIMADVFYYLRAYTPPVRPQEPGASEYWKRVCNDGQAYINKHKGERLAEKLFPAIADYLIEEAEK